MLNAFFLKKTRRQKYPLKKNRRGGGRKQTIKTRKIKKMNCNPAIEEKTANESTCYTDDILIQIRNAYNQNQPEPANRISATLPPSSILEELRVKMRPDCEKENCWLKYLTPQQREVVEERVFAPKKPDDWKKNPVEWLSNHDILNVLKQYEEKYPTFKFIEPTSIDFDTVLKNGEEGGKAGSCVSDDLCKFSLESYIQQGKKQMGIIFNLDRHDQKGSHWVSLFIDIEKSVLFYFDSAANKTPPEIKRLVERIQTQAQQLSPPRKYTYYENYPHEHQKSNTECGMYSLFFIITMLDKSKLMKSKIRMFNHGVIKDAKMIKLRDSYFND
jgi:hypothetical protein